MAESILKDRDERKGKTERGGGVNGRLVSGTFYQSLMVSGGSRGGCGYAHGPSRVCNLQHS